MPRRLREKLAVNVSFGDGQKHFLAVGGTPVTSAMTHTQMQVTHCTTSFYSTERRQERFLLTSLKSSLCLCILLMLHSGHFFPSHFQITVIFLLVVLNKLFNLTLKTNFCDVILQACMSPPPLPSNFPVLYNNAFIYEVRLPRSQQSTMHKHLTAGVSAPPVLSNRTARQSWDRSTF